MNASGETRKGFPLTLPLPCDMRGCEQQNLWVITKRKTSLWMVFLFGMPRAGWNSLPRPARSASNPEVKAGLLRMALPFVGCREASSSLVYFAAQSAKNKETPSDRMVFLFEMPQAGWNSLPRPARSASNPEVKAGLPRMALPFVGCREASSSLVYFAAQSAKNKETPSVRMVFSFWNAAGRVGLAASTCAKRVKLFRRGRRPRRPVSAAVPRWERISTSLRAAKQVPLGYSSE